MWSINLLGSLHCCMVTVQLLTQLIFTLHYDAEVTRLRIVSLFQLWQWFIALTEIFRKVATNISLLNYSTLWIVQLIRRYIQHTHPICLCEHLYTKRQFLTVLAISFWHINQSATLSIDGQFVLQAHCCSLHLTPCCKLSLASYSHSRIHHKYSKECVNVWHPVCS